MTQETETIEQQSIVDQLTDEQIDQLWAEEVEKEKLYWNEIAESGEWYIK
jgi:hypothetical protein